MMRTTLKLILSATTLACVQAPAGDAGSETSSGTTDPSSTSTGSSSSSTGESDDATGSEETGPGDTSSEESSTETSDTGDDSGGNDGCPAGLTTYVAPVDLFLAASESDLDPLVGVQCFVGSLWLSDGIVSLTKLDSLEVVIGSVYIGDSGGSPHLLTSLEGLENLTYIDGGIEINSSSLVSLAGLDGLTEVEEVFTIRKANLQNVDPLAQLKRVGAGFQLGFPEGGGPSVEQIQGLSGLTEVGALTIRYTTGLSSLAGLENLESIGYVVIVGNLDLTDVTPLGGGQAITIPFGLSIADNPNLPTCNAWALANGLDVQGGVGISNNLPDACGD